MNQKIETLENFYHEIANISPLLKKSSDQILIALHDNKKIDRKRMEHHTQQINEMIEVIDAHLSFVNIDLNPEIYNYQQPQMLNIHGTFFRISKIFRGKSKEKNLKLGIHKVGDDIRHVEVLPIAKVLPYIILDNAVKYSPSYQDIDIEFSQLDNGKIQVTCSSMGPIVEEKEIERLFDKGYRGEIAENSNPTGRGIGLYYLKKICELSKIKYEVSSGKSSFLFDGNRYSEFKIKLELE